MRPSAVVALGFVMGSDSHRIFVYSNRSTEVEIFGSVFGHDFLLRLPDAVHARKGIGSARGECVLISDRRPDNRHVSVGSHTVSEFIAFASALPQYFRKLSPGVSITPENVGGAGILSALGIFQGRADDKGVRADGDGEPKAIRLARILSREFGFLDPPVSFALEHVNRTGESYAPMFVLGRTYNSGIAKEGDGFTESSGARGILRGKFRLLVPARADTNKDINRSGIAALIVMFRRTNEGSVAVN